MVDNALSVLQHNAKINNTMNQLFSSNPRHMPNVRAKQFSWAAAIFLLVTVSGCGAPEMIGTHIGGDLTSQNLGYPDENLNSVRVVEISGAISPRLQIKLTAHYLTNGAVGCESTSSFIAGAVEGAKRPSSVSIPLEMRAHGQEYSADLVIDKFVPGRCEWKLGEVDAEVSEDGKVSMPNRIILAHDQWNNSLKDTDSENSLNTPVFLHCNFQQPMLAALGGQTNACVTASSPRSHIKRVQYYRDGITTVIVNFIDDESK